MAWPETVRKEDLRIEYFRGSGKGGQNRNKRDTACRITHKETGLFATAEEHKTQLQNRKAAFKRLSDKLVPLMKEAAQVDRPPISTERIRTYHEHRQQVKDHRIEGQVFNYSDVLDGKGLDEIINNLRIVDVEDNDG